MIDYIRIARFDHWFKNIFMLPGIVMAMISLDMPFENIIWPLFIAVLSTGFVASANYTINEWLDAESDGHHPIKKNRPSATGKVKVLYVYIQYCVLIIAGLSLASYLSLEFLVFSIMLLMMGVLYNVKPFRIKDRIYLDVLSESINNPLRFLLGWSAIASSTFPPSSILISYWMGGAFLMAVKRYAEFRYIDNHSLAGEYRLSFLFYNEEKLLLSSFFYALASSFFLGIFLIKYRVEFILSFPLFALLFTWYLHIGMKPHSAAQTPEKLYNEPVFLIYVIFISVFTLALFFIDIPWLHVLVNKVDY